jgi:predicted Zn-dependent protease
MVNRAKFLYIIFRRMKDLSIGGNIFDLLKNVEAVNQEAQWVYSAVYAPYY